MEAKRRELQVAQEDPWRGGVNFQGRTFKFEFIHPFLQMIDGVKLVGNVEVDYAEEDHMKEDYVDSEEQVWRQLQG